MHPTDMTALEKLAAELDSRGFTAQLVTPPDRLPSLEISNPRATALSDTVIAEGGFFWWSWEQQLAEITDVGTAADTICRVLAARPGEGA